MADKSEHVERIKEEVAERAVKAGETYRKVDKQARAFMEDASKDVRNFMDNAMRQSQDFVQKHPAAAVAGAATFGYLVGRILSRWR